MKKSFKTVTSHLLVFTLAVGSLGALPAGSVLTEPEAEAASRQVWLGKKSTTLTIRQDANKITKDTAKISIRKAKGVKLKSVKYKIGDKDVIKINNKGKITPKNMGATTVTLAVRYRYKGKTRNKNLKYKVRVNQVYKHILKGLTLQYLNYATFVDGAQGIKPCYDTTVTMSNRFDAWDCLSMTVEDPTVAEVGNDGLIIGKKVGTTTVTIRSTDDTDFSVTAALKVVAERKDLTENDDLYESVRAEYMAAIESGWTEEDKTRYIMEDGTVIWSQFLKREFMLTDEKDKILRTYFEEKKYPDNSSQDALNSLLTTTKALKSGGEAADDAYLQLIRDKVVAPIHAANSIDELIAVSEDLEKRGLVGFLSFRKLFLYCANNQFYYEVMDRERDVTDEPVNAQDTYMPMMSPPNYMSIYLFESKDGRKRAKAYLKEFFKLMGYDSLSAKELDDYAEFIHKFSVAYQETISDPEYATLKEFSERLPNLKIREHLEKMGYSLSDSDYIELEAQGPYEVLNSYLGKKKYLNALKLYLTEASTFYLTKYSTIAQRAYYETNPETVSSMGLSSADEAADFDVKKQMDKITDEIGWDMDHIFTSTVFSEDFKAQFEKMVQEYKDAYREAITDSEYGETFKKNMLEKLDHMQEDCLYPDEATYKEYCIPYDLTTASEGGNLVENLLKIAQYHADLIKMSIGTISGSKPWWHPDEDPFDEMPSEDNAFNLRFTDRCVFCYGGIGLNSIFFDNPNGDVETDVKNIGYMATTIGHEMGHAFDWGGSKVSYDGNMVNLWGTDDRSVYDNKVEKLSRHYNIMLFYADRDTNTAYYQPGNNVIDEAMADLGGTEIALRIVKKKYPGRDDLIRKFFRYTAEQWMTTELDYLSPEYFAAYYNDEHPLSWARTNGVASMMDDYYRVFNVAETDAMYVAPEKRVKLW